MNKSSNLLLREHPWKPFWFSNFWKDKSSGFLNVHDFVVLLQPEHGMFKMRNTVAIPFQEHRQIVINVSLGKIVRELVEIQHSLRNLQSVVIDSTIRVLSQAEFFGKKRNAITVFRYGFNRLVQICFVHDFS